MALDRENTKYKEEYEKYEEAALGKLNEQEKILKNMTLVGISRTFFTHSLPLAATERCYIELMKQVRDIIVHENTKTKRKKAYETLVKIIEEYNLKLLSTKVYWDNPDEKSKYKMFWDKYNKINKIEDEEERYKQKLIIFLKEDIKKLYINKRKYKKIINLHKEYLVELGAMRVFKNKCKTTEQLLKGNMKLAINKCR